MLAGKWEAHAIWSASQASPRSGSAALSYHGHIVDGSELVDEVLFTYMRAPRTYTAEDVVEIHGHGGPTPLERILHLVIARGARLANPGEFTLRAFINGRLDLAQAEAVADVISSRSEASLRLAVNQLSGRLSEAVEAVRRRVLGLLAQLEANIDFSEDDVPPPPVGPMLAELAASQQDLERLLRAADEGILYRRGARVAIVGRPNAGKSSLLNALLRTNRAIVTPIAGTTRDTIEESITIDGLPIVLIDTAGITETSDAVERIGVERSRQAISEADLIIFVYDVNVGWRPEDDEILAGLPRAKPTLIAVNKVDMGTTPSLHTSSEMALEVSALTGQGLADLESALRKELGRGTSAGVDDILVNNLRHKTLLEEALGHLCEASESLVSGRPADFISIDLRGALTPLGTITGTEVTESLLDEIFSRFCIGK